MLAGWRGDPHRDAPAFARHLQAPAWVHRLQMGLLLPWRPARHLCLLCRPLHPVCPGQFSSFQRRVQGEHSTLRLINRLHFMLANTWIPFKSGFPKMKDETPAIAAVREFYVGF